MTVDHACVTRLVDDVGAAAVTGMIDRFLELLPGRIARLREAVTSGDPAEVRDAALSLGCSASMLGAVEVAAASDRCRTDPATAGAALAALERLSGPSAQELQAARPALSQA